MVAITPMIQPAAVGTQWNLEVGRLRVTVIGRQDIPCTCAVGRRPPDGAGVLLAGTVARFLRRRTGFAEGELQALQPVAHRPGMRAEILRRGAHQAGQRGDQPAGLVEVAVHGDGGIGAGAPTSRPRHSSASPPPW